MSDNMNMAELMAVVTSIPRSAAAEAIEAANLAQEVKESIPADYSELSADVTEIKGAYAAKTDTVLETTLSRGRKEGTTVGIGSVAFGGNVEASGNQSHAEGSSSIASGTASHAEGMQSIASGNYSHTEGRQTNANGSQSHAEGRETIANAVGSHTEGYGTIANARYSHISGKYNIEDSYTSWPEWVANTSYVVGDKVKVTVTADNVTTVTGYICKTDNSDAEFTVTNWTKDSEMNFAEIIGNGIADNARSNAYALDWDGNGHYIGDVYVECNADSSGGTKLVKDIQVNGTSVVADGVANVPIASSVNLGLVYASGSGGGIAVTADGLIKISTPSLSDYQKLTSNVKAPVLSGIHRSVFYGLSKAAGADLKDETVTFGTYPADAIDKILAMLGVTDLVAPHEASSTASKAYSVGDAFIYAGKLYKVTVDIAIGGTITPDTNCTQTTLVELMKG